MTEHGLWFSPDGAGSIATIFSAAWLLVEFLRIKKQKAEKVLEDANAKVEAAEKAALDKEIEDLKKSQDIAWRRIDSLGADLTKCVTREEQEKARLELKADLAALEGRLVREMERLVGHKGA